MEAYAQQAAQTAASNQPPGMMGFFTLILMMFLISYIFVIKPQQNREKKRREIIEKLKKGDPVVSSGGLRGRVVDLKKEYAVVRIANDVKVEISKDAIHPLAENQGNS
jgi:preprotein translocase subunit YajC